MKQKKFHAVLISKSSIIKFFALILCIGAAVYFSKHISLPCLNENNFSKIADIALDLSVPRAENQKLDLEFNFLAKTAVRAAGLEIFSPYTSYENYTDAPSAPAALPYTPLADSPSPSPSAPPVTDNSNIVEKTFSGKYAAVSVDNKTNFTIDTSALLNAPVPIKQPGSDPLVLIVHTHSTESYTPSQNYNYTPTSNSRTTDKNYNIIRVGDEFEKGLRENGINVIHDTSLNDYPSYNGSYKKTLGVIEEYLKKYPSIQIVLDVHRDSMTASDGTKYKVSTEIDGKKCAQLMIVAGTSQGGLPHPDWRENLKLALKFQSKLNSDYNKIARPLSLRTERFNTHATKGSMIIEVGTDGNTLDEAILCASYASKSIADVIKSQIN